MDLIKECVQSAANGASWSRLTYQPPGGAQDTTVAASAPQRGWFHRRSGEAEDPTVVKAMLRRMFKQPTNKTPEDAQVTDVDQLVLTGNKKKRSAQQQQRMAGAADSEEDDLFVDLRTGSIDLGPEKLIEVREALPFMWAGRSPFWSPLLLRRGLLEPLRELTRQGIAEKVSFTLVLLLCTAVAMDRPPKLFSAVFIQSAQRD